MNDYERWLRGGVQGQSRLPYRIPDPPFRALINGKHEVEIDSYTYYGGLRFYRADGFGLVQAHQLSSITPLPTNNRGGRKPAFLSHHSTPTSPTARAEYRRRCLDTRAWLQRELASGPKPASEVLSQARADKIPIRGLYRAKRKLLVVSSRVGGFAERGVWLWRLP